MHTRKKIPVAGNRSRTLSVKAPPGAAVFQVQSFYTRAAGLEQMCVKSTEVGGVDVYNDWQRRFSPDNGMTWSAWEPIPDTGSLKTPKGVRCLYPMVGGWVDPVNGRLLTMLTDGVMPTPLAFFTHYTLRYRVSIDGGRTCVVDELVIQQGNYTAENPAEGVEVGRNSIYVGAVACQPIRTRQGNVLVPVQITPTGGYYFDSAVLVGTWTDDMKIMWNLSQRVLNQPKQSTKGVYEPTIAEMDDGRILMIMRGDGGPGCKWYSVSTDGGWHWSAVKSWTCADGTGFYSPASCSQLLKHSNGKYYWIGNICPTAPDGQLPRHPLVIGEVDTESLLLLKDTLATIDTREPGDPEGLQLSNFLAHEDRADGTIMLDMTRYMPDSQGRWVGDAYVYRIAVPTPESASRFVDHSQLLVYSTPDGRQQTVKTAEDWAIRRRQILQGMELAMGNLPDRSKLHPPEVKIIDRAEGDGFTRFSITYLAEENDRVPAYLFLPKDLPAGRRIPAMLALHQTTALGKKEVAGEGGSPNLAYAKELVRRGYVVLAPDYPSFGDYAYDFTKDNYVSGTMKGIFNNLRGVDLLQARIEVDPGRIGAIGHSLGGHNAMFLGVFDPRVKVVVASCGWTTFHDDVLADWTSDRYLPRVRDIYGNDPDRVPFDFYEVVAALAPRAFFSNSPLHDSGFDVRGVKKAESKAREVFALLGAADKLQIRYPDCTHDFPVEVRREAYEFIDRIFQ